MIKALLKEIDKQLFELVDIENISQEQLKTVHSLIKGKKNNLLNRTLFYLLSEKLYREDFSKIIEADVNSSLEDPFYNLISSLIQKAPKQNSPKTTGKLSKKENILLNALEEARYERQQLILMIYGEDCDYLKAETSFKSLLYRFKKKIDGEITISPDGIYSLSV
ncbi:hypothetical protein [Halobacteriovorax sp. ZH4_bin.1]|uniref:hypothetical protein n=1 Tax=unclassified Halobacteriovorax TaxID=2639665 RepID=UPI00372167AD